MSIHHRPPGHPFGTAIIAGLLAGLVSCAASGQAAQTPTQGSPKITLTNLDGLPAPERLVFSRIGSPAGSAVHDQVTLRVSNGGGSPLHLSSLPIAGPWQLGSSVSLPLSVAAGASVDLPIRFVAAPAPQSPPQLSGGSLTIKSDDPATPSLKVDLAGLWQSAPEQSANGTYSEPSLEQIVAAFGYPVKLYTAADAAPLGGDTGGGNVPINQHGAVKPQGDEVISAYWQRADQSQPVSVQEIAAYEGPSASTLSWYAQGGALTPIVTHAAQDSQTVLPRAPGSSVLAAGTFTAAGSFGFNAGGQDFSDPTKNDASNDLKAGCTGPCGQHLRFWPVAGQANTYLLAVDRLGINFDYQDNVYLIRNIAPATP